MFAKFKGEMMDNFVLLGLFGFALGWAISNTHRIVKLKKEIQANDRLINEILDKLSGKSSEVLEKKKTILDWEEFEPVPKSADEVFSGERKYNPDSIEGVFDKFFEEN